MPKPTIIFFGSFLEYSAHVLEQLHKSDKVEITGVVTTPPKPAGRKKELRQTQVHQYALDNNLQVFTPEKLNQEALDHLLSAISNKPSLFCVAGYGKLLPKSWLALPKIAPINIHFSLLPKYRGAMPGEWAMFMGESETGVSLIEMSPKLDAGAIVAQAKYQIKAEDNRESLYQKLYGLGAELFLESLDTYLEFKAKPQLKHLQTNPNLFLPPKPQQKSVPPYARLVSKDETFVDWRLIEAAMNGDNPDEKLFSELLWELPSKVLTAAGWAEAIERMIRAFYGWPGVWTLIETKSGRKRMKLHTAHLRDNRLVLDQVQVEGKKVQGFSLDLIG